MENVNVVLFSGNANGGALVVSGTTIHNGVFTNTDYNTVAGRQSLTSKSSNAYGKYIFNCAVASKANSIYVCTYTDNGIGKVLFIELDPAGTTEPKVTVSGVFAGVPTVNCFGLYCYTSEGAFNTKLKRFSSTPANPVQVTTCAGDN